jgi:hypothetical protein
VNRIGVIVSFINGSLPALNAAVDASRLRTRARALRAQLARELLTKSASKGPAIIKT